jgi:hypothetical protein
MGTPPRLELPAAAGAPLILGESSSELLKRVLGILAGIRRLQRQQRTLLIAWGALSIGCLQLAQPHH